MYKLTKRLLDWTIALVVLALTLIISLPCILCLWLTGEHKVWYLQKRVGYKTQRFNIFKFATMLKNSPNMGTGSLTLRRDSRVLPMGGFLRKTKINELPQVFNIFNGTMSIVGPRPQMEIDFHRFPLYVQEVIYNVPPGITGIGSIVFRDEERYMSAEGVDSIKLYCEKIAPYKGELEIWYQNHASTMTDIKIILLTAWTIINSKSELHYKWFKDLPQKPDWMNKI